MKTYRLSLFALVVFVAGCARVSTNLPARIDFEEWLFYSVPISVMVALETCIFAWGCRFGLRRAFKLALGVNVAMFVIPIYLNHLNASILPMIETVAVLEIFAVLLFRHRFEQDVEPEIGSPASPALVVVLTLVSLAMKFGVCVLTIGILSLAVAI